MTESIGAMKRRVRAASGAFDKAVGARIRKHRNRLGLSQNGLAAMVDMNDSSFSRVEKGETSCGPFLLARLAKIFGRKAGALIDGIEVPL